MNPEEWVKPIFIISSDTLVETPVVVDQINKTLKLISQKAKELSLPIYTEKVKPKVEDTFWVNLIGKGYPAPSRNFRWCTERMKIKPANIFVIDQAAKYGEVVMVLGARKSEGMSRAQVLSKQSRKIAGNILRRHSSLSRAYTYTPIEDFSTDDVWTYLLQVPSPWGGNNRDLAALYRRTETGECPLVVDTSTPSCGNSRFGCWVCTVVDKDKTMQTLIDTGEEWMEPLLDYRDMLSSTQDPETKSHYREYKRRDGQVIVKGDKFIPGPYKAEYRLKFLHELLKIQVKLQKEGPDPDLVLISSAELHEIRRIWMRELPELADPIPQMYYEIVGEALIWSQGDTGFIGDDDLDLIKEICQHHNVPVSLIFRLLETERRMDGMGRRAGIFDTIRSIVEEEWGSQNEILSRVSAEKDFQLRLGIE